MINSVVLVGRVGKDPEMKYFESGKSKTTFSVAVNRWHSAEKKEVADWFFIEFWDKDAERAGEYVKKGRLIAIEGRLDTWKDKEGDTRFVVKGNKFHFLGGKNEGFQQES